MVVPVNFIRKDVYFFPYIFCNSEAYGKKKLCVFGKKFKQMVSVLKLIPFGTFGLRIITKMYIPE